MELRAGAAHPFTVRAERAGSQPPHHPHSIFSVQPDVVLLSRCLLYLYRHILPGFPGPIQDNNGEKRKINPPFHVCLPELSAPLATAQKAAVVTAGIRLTRVFRCLTASFLLSSVQSTRFEVKQAAA